MLVFQGNHILLCKTGDHRVTSQSITDRAAERSPGSMPLAAEKLRHKLEDEATSRVGEAEAEAQSDTISSEGTH